MDYTALYASLYSRAATDSAGSTVRALVNSIFRAMTPLNFNGKTLPYLMWKETGVGGASGEPRPIGAAWWIYIGPTDDIRKLWQVSTALESLYGYTNRHALAHMRIGVTFIGQPFYDAALKLQGQEVRIEHRDRG